MVTSSSNFGQGWMGGRAGLGQVIAGGENYGPGAYLHGRNSSVSGSTTGTNFVSGGTSTGGQTWQEMMAEVQAKMDEANAANEARYGAIRGGESDIDAAAGGYKGLRERSLGYVDAISNQQELDAQRMADERWGSAQQGMYASGLSGTTIMPTMKMGYDRERDAEIRRIQDAKMQQRLGVDASTTGNMLGFMERREDIGPNMEWYANLLKQRGQSVPWMTGSAGKGAQEGGGGGGPIGLNMDNRGKTGRWGARGQDEFGNPINNRGSGVMGGITDYGVDELYGQDTSWFGNSTQFPTNRGTGEDLLRDYPMPSSRGYNQGLGGSLEELDSYF